MLKNYLKIALRNLRRNKLYSFINIAGLSIGIAGSLLILFYVAGQLSYESMQKKRDNIVRVSVKFGRGNGSMNFAGAMPALGPAAASNFSDVKAAVRFRVSRHARIKVGNRLFHEHNFFFADSSVFNVFTFPLLKGNKETALKNPSSIVISQAIAKKYFGNENPIGKAITYDDKYKFTVSAVMKNVPRNTMLRPEIIAPYSREKEIQKSRTPWNSFGSTFTYLLLKKNASLGRLHKNIRQLLIANTSKQFASRLHFVILRLANIHFKSKAVNELAPTTDMSSIYIFSTIAILVLIIACLNFINLSTARSLRRSKEVGIRKVMGARRRSLIGQLLGESVLVTLIAVILGLIIFQILHPLLNGYLDVRLNINPFKTTYFYLILSAIVICVSLLSGLYPAIFISKFTPVDSLKSQKTPGSHSVTLRKLLVGCQFAITIFLIIGTAVAYKQLHFMLNSNLGFNKQNVIIVQYPANQKNVESEYSAIRQKFLSIPGVKAVSGAFTLPGISSKKTETIRPKGKPTNDISTLQAIGVGYDFIHTLGLKLIKGRDFSRKFSTDKKGAIIINQTAVKRLDLKKPIGTEVYLPDGSKEGKVVKVIGVVKDFHISSFNKMIPPLFMYINPKEFYNIALRVNPRYTNTIIASLHKKWSSSFPDIPFNYSFLSQKYNAMYKHEITSDRLFAIFSFLSIFIACMGILGLISYTIEVKIKEISIRKVLGASVADIVIMFFKDFLKLVVIGFVIAVPVAWYGMHRWLQNFAYKINPSPWIFLGAGALALFIALATVSWQAIRAALMNPVDALRSE